MAPVQKGDTARPRLILADDHHMVAESLATCLGQHCDIIGVAFGAFELLALLKRAKADCLLLDFAMPEKNGLELIPAVRRLNPDLKIIVVTMLPDSLLAQAALGAGASGFVPKDAPVAELLVAIHEVLAGHRHVSPRVPKTSHRIGLEARHLGLHQLTPRQHEIVLLFGEGRSALEVSRTLGISPSAITFHKHNIMRALGIDTDGALVRYAVLVRAGIEVGAERSRAAARHWSTGRRP